MVGAVLQLGPEGAEPLLEVVQQTGRAERVAVERRLLDVEAVAQPFRAAHAQLRGTALVPAVHVAAELLEPFTETVLRDEVAQLAQTLGRLGVSARPDVVLDALADPLPCLPVDAHPPRVRQQGVRLPRRVRGQLALVRGGQPLGHVRQLGQPAQRVVRDDDGAVEQCQQRVEIAAVVETVGEGQLVRRLRTGRARRGVRVRIGPVVLGPPRLGPRGRCLLRHVGEYEVRLVRGGRPGARGLLGDVGQRRVESVRARARRGLRT